MNLDTEFLKEYVAFLKIAFPASLNAEGSVGHADIMVYGLAAKLCSLIGTKLDFLDFVPQEKPGDKPDRKPRADHGAPGGGGPHFAFHGPSGGGGPHLQMLISYATDVSTPQLADAFRKANSES